MKLIKVWILLTAGMIVGSTVWSGCYTRLAIGSDSTVQEAESDTTVINQMTAINEVAQSVLINDPWGIGLFTPLYFPSPFAGSRFHKKGIVSTYRPLPLTGTPSASSGANPQAPTPHRQSGYQRSAPPDENNSRNAESTPPRTSQVPPPASSPSVPTTRTPTASAPPTGTPTTSAPPATNRGGGATRSGR